MGVEGREALSLLPQLLSRCTSTGGACVDQQSNTAVPRTLQALLI